MATFHKKQAHAPRAAAPSSSRRSAAPPAASASTPRRASARERGAAAASAEAKERAAKAKAAPPQRASAAAATPDVEAEDFARELAFAMLDSSNRRAEMLQAMGGQQLRFRAAPAPAPEREP